MPFTETQPININNLLIEPVQIAESRYRPTELFNEDELIQIKIAAQPHERKIIFQQTEVEEEGKFKMYQEAEKEEDINKYLGRFKNAMLFKDYNNAANLAVNLKMIGYQVKFSQTDKQQLTDYLKNDIFLGQSYHANLQILGLTKRNTKTIDALHATASATNTPILSISAYCSLRLLGESTNPINPDLLNFMKKSIQDNSRNWNTVAHLMHDMLIVTADEAIFEDHGVQLIYHTNTNFNETPPVPVVKNF